ncbi:MAG: maltose acetyltransferase domain-containing protein [Sporolactobacillus sp.]
MIIETKKARRNLCIRKQKKITGTLYDSGDPELIADRVCTRERICTFNSSLVTERERRIVLLKELFGTTGDRIYIEPTFHCNYGYNIHVDDHFYANFDCVILDCAPVVIGHHCLHASGVHIYSRSPANPHSSHFWFINPSGPSLSKG